MPNEFSSLDLAQIRQLRQFKIDYSQVRVLQYIDEAKRPPQSFAQYRELAPPAALVTEEVPRPTFPADLRYLQQYAPIQFPKGKVLVLVNYDLFPALQAALSQYVQDLAYEGYFAVVHRVKGGTPPELRSFIKAKQPTVGALMVGSLPVAWFEMSDDFNGPAEFPCDLYYMDLNGLWNDPDGDGKFSEHPSGVEPEIWIGRLWTPTGGGNDAALLNDYFSRNHRFRKGLFGCANRGLAFVDDDWVGFGDCALDYALPAANVETITDPALTDADRYKAEVHDQRAWAQVCVHSSPSGHSFKTPGGNEWIGYAYLRDVNPPNAYFYNLFACSNALFTQADCMAGWYIFDKAGGSVCSGLIAVGSTKTGSMLAFENFYGPMGSGRTTGEAFVDWWKALGSSHDLGKRRWHYGLTLLGDPTLNWWTGAVPALRNPLEGDTFDHFPRLTHLRWDPIPLSGASYNVEIDAFGAQVAGQWAAESGHAGVVSGSLPSAAYEHNFVGMQRGRWRVRANVNGRASPWSDWRYFTYTV